MTDELFGRMIQDEINEIILENSGSILSQLQSCDPKLSPETVKLLTKAISFSAQISVQYTIRLLENCGLLSLPKDGQPVLSVVPKKEPPVD